MHTMAHYPSEDHRASRGSRNGAASVAFGPNCTTTEGNVSRRNYSVLELPGAERPHRSPPRDPNSYSDTSDSDDCESVGSNRATRLPTPGIYNQGPKTDKACTHLSGGGTPPEINHWTSGGTGHNGKSSRSGTHRISGAMRNASAERSLTDSPAAAQGKINRQTSNAEDDRGGGESPKAGVGICPTNNSPQKEEQQQEEEDGLSFHDEGDGGGCNDGGSESSRSRSDGAFTDRSGISVNKPYPPNWRYFGRRPPAVLECRPLGEIRVRNVRPAGNVCHLGRHSDANGGCQRDAWDPPHGLAKPITDRWTTPLPYGTQITRAGDIDPCFEPSRGDLVIINPAQLFFRDLTLGHLITYRGPKFYKFGIGDLIIRLGRFTPDSKNPPKWKYVPYANLELYMYTPTREMRLLGRQPEFFVQFYYGNVDYESLGKGLEFGTALPNFFPRRGDIIIRGDVWAENYPNIDRKHESSVIYWTIREQKMEFITNDMLVRPYVGYNPKSHWGAAHLYQYCGRSMNWVFFGKDTHIYDAAYPREQEHGIKTGHHKDEVGHYSDAGGAHTGGFSRQSNRHHERTKVCDRGQGRTARTRF